MIEMAAKQMKDERRGACHCGKVQFRVALTDGLATARRCTCSFCRMRGAIAVSADIKDLTITEGVDALTAYRFNTKAAIHYFCSVCGIYTHHKASLQPERVWRQRGLP